jgi:hypothetical protein
MPPRAGRWVSAQRGSTSGATATPRVGGRAARSSRCRSARYSPRIGDATAPRGSPPSCVRRAGGAARTRSRRSWPSSGWSPAASAGAAAAPGPGGVGGGPRAPDLIGSQFAAAQVNRKWYGDGTEIVTDEGKLYLDSVLDRTSRRVVGFAVGEHHDAELAYAALAMAVAVRGGRDAIAGVILHADRGSEGGFNRSSQHLDREVRCGDGKITWLGCCGDGSASVAVAGSGAGGASGTPADVSGRQSPQVLRVTKLALRPAWRRRSPPAGSASVAAWRRRRSWLRFRAGICPSPSARRSRSAAHVGLGCGRSPDTWTLGVDGVAGTTPQRCHPRRDDDLPGDDRTVASGPPRGPAEDRQNSWPIRGCSTMLLHLRGGPRLRTDAGPRRSRANVRSIDREQQAANARHRRNSRGPVADRQVRSGGWRGRGTLCTR